MKHHTRVAVFNVPIMVVAFTANLMTDSHGWHYLVLTFLVLISNWIGFAEGRTLIDSLHRDTRR